MKAMIKHMFSLRGYISDDLLGTRYTDMPKYLSVKLSDIAAVRMVKTVLGIVRKMS